MSRSLNANRPWYLLLALLVASVPVAVYGQGETNHHRLHNKDYKREIEEAEQDWRTATLNGDVAAMDKLLADDYVGISMSGQVNTKAQQLDRLRNRTTVLTKVDLSDIRIKIVGTVAIVNGFAQVVGTNDGVPVNGEYRYTRVYKLLMSGFWKITTFEVTRIPPRLASTPPAK